MPCSKMESSRTWGRVGETNYLSNGETDADRCSMTLNASPGPALIASSLYLFRSGKELYFPYLSSRRYDTGFQPVLVVSVLSIMSPTQSFL